MKKQESSAPQSKKKEIVLTEEQFRTNGGGVWEGFLDTNRKAILKILDENKDVNNNPDLASALSDAIKGLKNDKKGLVSENELLLRGLEYYRDERGGFGDAKALNAKYEELRKLTSEERAKKIVERFIGEEVDYDDANDRIEEEVKKYMEESATDPDIDTFRDTLWKEFTEKTLK
ncbi:MAG: hypothetical protein WC878_00325 [Candidatus Paceibacterota bacterium]|jgi:hypothetical protein